MNRRQLFRGLCGFVAARAIPSRLVRERYVRIDVGELRQSLMLYLRENPQFRTPQGLPEWGEIRMKRYRS